MQALINKVKAAISEYNMINKGETVIVALSGGADSVCLLHVLYSLSGQMGFKVIAAHINHMLRGSQANADADFARAFCESLNIEFYQTQIDIAALARDKGISEEAAGRQARYEYLQHLKIELGADKIATAHNKNDQAETVLMRLIRGSGLLGLGAIRHISANSVIRPLLSITRSEIEGYCHENNLKYVTDSTNSQTIYTRNRVRLELIPYIKENFNPNIITTLYNTAELLSSDNRYLEHQAQKITNKYVKKDEIGVYIEIGKLLKADRAIARRVIRNMHEILCGNSQDIEFKHIEQILCLAGQGRTGTVAYISKSVQAKICYDRMYLANNSVKKEDYEYELIIGKSVYIKELQMHIRAEVADAEEVQIADKYTASFDLEALQRGLKIRNRRRGDVFKYSGISKKIKDYFIDKKIPRDKREGIPLLCAGDDILWIIGYRKGDLYKAKPGRAVKIDITYGGQLNYDK